MEVDAPVKWGKRAKCGLFTLYKSFSLLLHSQNTAFVFLHVLCFSVRPGMFLLLWRVDAVVLGSSRRKKKLPFLPVKAAAGGSYVRTHFIPRIPENYLTKTKKKKKDNILKKTCFVLISVNCKWSQVLGQHLSK